MRSRLPDLPVPTVRDFATGRRDHPFMFRCDSCHHEVHLCLPGLILAGHGDATAMDLRRIMRCRCGGRGYAYAGRWFSPLTPEYEFRD